MFVPQKRILRNEKMKEEITEQKLGAVLWDIVESFKPNDEDCPYSFLDITKNLKRTELIDLTQLPPNSFLYVHGSHTRASYWLLRLNEEKGQRVVDVWRDLDTNGLRAPIDKIISVEIKGSDEKTLWIVERGIIRQGFNMAFQYLKLALGALNFLPALNFHFFTPFADNGVGFSGNDDYLHPIFLQNIDAHSITAAALDHFFSMLIDINFAVGHYTIKVTSQQFNSGKFF